VTPRLAKAALYVRLRKAGYTLAKGHRATLDRLLQRDGYIMPETVVEQAKEWGWTEEQTKELRKALK
jgi:hypothetical protein